MKPQTTFCDAMPCVPFQRQFDELQLKCNPTSPLEAFTPRDVMDITFCSNEFLFITNPPPYGEIKAWGFQLP